VKFVFPCKQNVDVLVMYIIRDYNNNQFSSSFLYFQFSCFDKLLLLLFIFTVVLVLSAVSQFPSFH